MESVEPEVRLLLKSEVWQPGGSTKAVLGNTNVPILGFAASPHWLLGVAVPYLLYIETLSPVLRSHRIPFGFQHSSYFRGAFIPS